MLGIGKIGGGGDGYYLEAVARGADEYYRGVGEAPGVWAGDGATGLGLVGDVDPDDLRAVWDGIDPATGDKLAAFPNRTVHALDLTFKAPKSVSLLFGLGADDVAAQVRAGHDAAVTAAIAYVEREATMSRAGKGGARPMAVTGLVAARFRHRTSRAGDPHLHTHVLCANLAQGVDGKWRTLDGRVLLQHALTAGHLYQAHLRHELTTRLGVGWGPVEHGCADIAGINRDVIVAFSERRRQIEEHLDQIGFRSARAAQLATLETRAAKDRTVDPPTMRHVWETKAAEIGFDLATLDDVLGRRRAGLLTRPQAEALLTHLRGPEGLTARASSFDRRDVLRALAERCPAGAPVSYLEGLADELVAHRGVVELVAPVGLAATSVIRRRDGSVVAAPLAGARWSTVELVRIEQQLVDRAEATVTAGRGMVADAIVEATVAARPSLRAEQIAMVARLTTGGAGVDVVAAAAGTGKTYALDAARAAWQDAGYTVIGASLAAEAAHELQAAAGIPSSTIASLQLGLDAGRVRLDARTVVVIDEAGMVGTRALAKVFDAADAAGAKVVLVGDPCQLPEIDAGGVLTGLAARLGPITLVENRRQRADWERGAVTQLRDGDIDAALDAYQQHDRLVTAPTAVDVRTTMVADWWAWRVTGADTRMLALRHSDVDDLNGRARAYLSRAGELHGPTLEIADRPYQAGDHIICLRNHRALGVRNGMTGVVDAVDVDRRTLTMRTADGERHQLPAGYLDAGHVAHGYATTIHKAQGKTVDRTLLLGSDELFRAHGYVGMSRGRDSNHLYIVATPDERSTDHVPAPETPAPLDLLRAGLHREHTNRLAIDTGDPLDLWPLERLADERDRLDAILDRCPTDRSRDLRSLVAQRQRLEHELEPLVARHNTLADKLVRGPKTRADLLTLRTSIGRTTDALHRVDTELVELEQAEHARARFVADHEPEAERRDTIAELIDTKLAARVEGCIHEPPGHLTSTLGFPPADPRSRQTWRHNATVIERYRLDLRINGTATFGRDEHGHAHAVPHDVRARLRVAHPTRSADRQDVGLGIGL